jgi:hypothetical protein
MQALHTLPSETRVTSVRTRLPNDRFPSPVQEMAGRSRAANHVVLKRALTKAACVESGPRPSPFFAASSYLRQRPDGAQNCHYRRAIISGVLLQRGRLEARVTEAAIIMAVCFAAGYALRARIAVRDRRRRMFRT